MIYIVKLSNLSASKKVDNMIDLRSDTVTLPSDKMKTFIMNAPLGDDVYNEDPSVIKLEDEIAEMFGKENALFVPSGTMANLISVLTHCNRGEEVLLGNKSHIFKYEVGGISAFGGIHSHQIKNNDDGTIDLNDIRAGIRNNDDVHSPRTSLFCLENTHNLCYGAPINTAYISEVKKILRHNNISLHIDGARIFNASVKLNENLSELAKDADSITCCLSKGLAAPVGSMIISNNTFINSARKLRKALGGGMRQVGIIASAGRYAIHNMFARLEEDHEHALLLSQKLKNISTIKIDLKKIHTNLIFFHLDSDKISDVNFINKLLSYNIKIDYKGANKFRLVTHYGFEKKDIDNVVNAFHSILK